MKQFISYSTFNLEELIHSPVSFYKPLGKIQKQILARPGCQFIMRIMPELDVAKRKNVPNPQSAFEVQPHLS